MQPLRCTGNDEELDYILRIIIKSSRSEASREVVSWLCLAVPFTFASEGCSLESHLLELARLGPIRQETPMLLLVNVGTEQVLYR